MTIDTHKLRGKYVYLEILSPVHSEIVRELARDERIWEFTKAFAINEAFDKKFDEYLIMAFDKNALGGQQAFVIRQSADDAIIGMTRFYEINPKDKRLAIGYTWYTPAVWGMVHNKECKLLLLQYVFETAGFNRAEFHVTHQNIRSQKAVEKIGGVKEGILRKHGYRNDGTIRNTVMFSIIDDEWPAKKENLIRLIAANENH
ncbi:MAG TPA: GNAT family protein [Chitinophagaceae bacterium]|nr:GNAT family protein [Chitinophagaceae bacterium]